MLESQVVPWLLWPSGLACDEQRRKVPRMRLWFFPFSVPTALDFLALRLLFSVTPAFQNLADRQTVRGSGELSVPLAAGRERWALLMLFPDFHPVFSL